MKSVNTAWCPHDYEKSSPLQVRWTRVTHPMGTRLTEEDQIAHAFRRLSLFFTAHAFRRLSFIHLACVFAHVRLDVSFFPLRIRTDVSFFFRCTCAQMYLFSFPLCIRSVVSLLWKAEKKGRGCSLGGDAWQPPSKPCLKFLTKICDLPYLSTATIY